MPYWRKRHQYSSEDDDESSLSDSSQDDYNRYCRSLKRPKFPKTTQPFRASYAYRRNDQERPHMHASASAGVYALKSSVTGICYVGKSSDIGTRIEQHHRQNEGDSLIREPLLTRGDVDDLESWERNEVLTRMYRNGLESVRGWKFTRRGQLTIDEKVSARDDIMEKFDLCRRCGRNNHFADKCFARTAAPWCSDIPMEH